jgi:hypothetical protein
MNFMFEAFVYFISFWAIAFRIDEHFYSYLKSLYVSGMGRYSTVGIATRYGMDGPGIESRWGARFSAFVQTGPGDPPSLLYNGYRVFPGGKAAGAWH